MTTAADTSLATAGAYARCADLARSHYENFAVRSRLVPRSARADLAAIYAFCRTTDDLGDEAAGDRLAAIDRWERDTLAALAGDAPAGIPPLVALGHAADRRGLDPGPFLRLIEANRRDQSGERFEDEEALLDYCSHSATPVGRMVLAVVGRDGRGLHVYADATCIGLQLANFWQDLRRDRERGRCYLPLDACRRHGVDPDVELDRPAASNALRGLVAELVEGAREWLVRGWPLASRLPMRWRPLVRGFTRGGWAVCDAIAGRGYDTLSGRPVVGGVSKAAIAIGETLRAPRRRVPPPVR